ATARRPHRVGRRRCRSQIGGISLKTQAAPFCPRCAVRWAPSAPPSVRGPVDPSILTAAERLQHAGWRRRAEADAAVLALHKDGVAIKEIVRRTGRARKVVRDVVRGGRAEPFRPRASTLEPWLDRLDTEWTAGCRNGAELWRRLRGEGF